MKKGIKKSFSNVISVNPYEKTYKSTISHNITDITSPEYSKNQYTISYLNTKNFITTKIEINKNIPEEDLADAIYSNVYYDMSLDQAVEFQIKYIESFTELDDENRHFYVFIIDPEVIEETFVDVVEDIKYLDTIIPSTLLFRTLYTKKIIQSNGTHCFIYFQEKDAFIAVYHNEEYIYSKSLDYTLEYLHEKFCEMYGEQITYKDFIKFISTKNLKDVESDYTEYLIKLYKEIFVNINDILNYIKRAHDLQKIDHIYIDAQISTVTKLCEMSEVELNIRSSWFDFNFELKSNHRYIDHLHALMQLYVDSDKKDRYECNFTLYPRPPKFIKRESGKVVILVAASIIISFAYPIVYWALTLMQIEQFDSLKEEYSKIHKEKIMKQVQVGKREKDLQKSLKYLKEETLNFASKKSTLKKIHKVQVGYLMKAKMLAQFTEDLNMFNVKTIGFDYSENNGKKVLIMDLVSRSDRNITNLIKHLTTKYSSSFTFTFKEIYFDEEKKKYFSKFKVSLL